MEVQEITVVASLEFISYTMNTNKASIKKRKFLCYLPSFYRGSFGG